MPFFNKRKKLENMLLLLTMLVQPKEFGAKIVENKDISFSNAQKKYWVINRTSCVNIVVLQIICLKIALKEPKTDFKQSVDLIPKVNLP